VPGGGTESGEEAFGVGVHGQVQAGFPGHQQLARHRGSGLEHDREDARRQQRLGGGQPGRAGADDGGIEVFDLHGGRGSGSGAAAQWRGGKGTGANR
jgi:hypothetical protein